MLPFETIRRFRPKDLAAILIAAIAYWVLSSLFSALTQETFYLNIGILLAIIAFTLRTVKRTGTATAICILITLIHPYVKVVPLITTIQHFTIMAVVGITFDLAFTLLKLEIQNTQVDVIAGAALSAAVIPWILALFTRFEWSLNLFAKILNLSITNFLIGIISASAATLVWQSLRRRKIFLKFEYE